jgi:hypothetical protein
VGSPYELYSLDEELDEVLRMNGIISGDKSLNEENYMSEILNCLGSMGFLKNLCYLDESSSFEPIFLDYGEFPKDHIVRFYGDDVSLLMRGYENNIWRATRVFQKYCEYDQKTVDKFQMEFLFSYPNSYYGIDDEEDGSVGKNLKDVSVYASQKINQGILLSSYWSY